jgi:uncharacterized protein (DUF2141 family)
MMIRKYLTGAVLAFVSLQAPAQNKVNVQISNFENNKGTCMVCLYDNANDFSDKGKPVQCSTVTITSKATTALFHNVKEGTYAILVIHDANNNRKFDTNFMGIPKEGYGASQNKLPFAGAPKFEENKFMVTNGATTQYNIRLRYIF